MKTIDYGGEPYEVVDVADRCVYCDEDTAFGSGKFVNRIPADTFCEERKQYRDGYACADCMSRECDRCEMPIEFDCDISPYDVYGEDAPTLFSDGSFNVCADCLTPEEAERWRKEWGDENL